MNLLLLTAILTVVQPAPTEVPKFSNCSSHYREVKECQCFAPGDGRVYCAVTIERTSQYTARTMILDLAICPAPDTVEGYGAAFEVHPHKGCSARVFYPHSRFRRGPRFVSGAFWYIPLIGPDPVPRKK